MGRGYEMDIFIGLGKIVLFCVIWWYLCDDIDTGRMRMKQVLISIVLLGTILTIPGRFLDFWVIDALWAQENLINLGIFFMMAYVFAFLPMRIMMRVIINIYKGYKKKIPG